MSAQLHGRYADRVASVKQPVHFNVAAYQLKLKDWQGAVWNCSQVQHTLDEIGPQNVCLTSGSFAQLHGLHADKAASVKHPVHFNGAACQLKDWQGAVGNCSQVQHALDKIGSRVLDIRTVSAQLHCSSADRAALCSSSQSISTCQLKLVD